MRAERTASLTHEAPLQRGSLNPAWLLPGTHVGPWRIVDLRGGGTYGVVYLAQGVEPEATGVVALKVARTPREPRFAREVELLSRLHHPAVPRLIAHGQWESPTGQPHPYLVMQWLEGLPLYEWARFRGPTSRQVLRVLADLARALEATHAARSVHRDVKGENVLVRLSDGQGFLIDFGSASYHGADTLTWQVFPPGTPAYRSPEAIAFAVNILRSPVKQYTATPTDDVFALGVTAYRLVTGQYPPTADPLDEGVHVWQEGGSGPQPARELNARCCPELSGLISRMLSLDPEARGSARELAETLEQAASDAGPEADASLFVPEAPPPVSVLAGVLEQTERDAEPDANASLFVPALGELADVREQTAKEADEPVLPSEGPPPVDVEATAPEEVEDSPRSISPQVAHPSSPPLFPAVLAVTVVLGVFWGLKAARMYFLEEDDEADAGSVAVGDEALTAPVEPLQEPSALSAIALDMPSKPLRGQMRPDGSGRCPSKGLVAINGGCWVKLPEDPKECTGLSYVYKGACYLPYYAPPPPSTSAPMEARDGG